MGFFVRITSTFSLICNGKSLLFQPVANWLQCKNQYASFAIDHKQQSAGNLFLDTFLFTTFKSLDSLFILLVHFHYL